MNQLDHLDTYGRLLGAHPDDDWDPNLDLVDGRALIRVVRGLRELSENLAGDADAQAGVKSFETWVMKRGGRVMFEELWELPRRRTLGQPLLSKKFAAGGLWSAAARGRMGLNARGEYEIVVPAANQGQELMLEHVVPASTIYELVGEMVHSNASADQIAAALRETVAHVVMTMRDDSILAKARNSHGRGGKFLSKEAKQAIFDHYLGVKPLSLDELFRHRWSRYLSAAAGPVGERLDLDELQPLVS